MRWRCSRAEQSLRCGTKSIFQIMEFFHEKRVFAPGPMPGPVNFRGVRLGLPICEDIWGAEVVECLAETGAEFLIVPNGSPYWRQKGDVRLNIAVARVTEQGLPTIYVNQVGGQDELVFDGVSFGLHSDCSLAFQLAGFQELIITTQWVRRNGTWRCENGPVVDSVEADRADYSACVLGLRDYVNKNGFPGVVLGLSGGIDLHCARRWRSMLRARSASAV